MKLYATTTSERASKGQGGNKRLQVSFKVMENGQPVQKCWANLEPDNLCIYFGEQMEVINHGTSLRINFTKSKGKQKKGEIAKQLKEDREHDAFNSGMQGEIYACGVSGCHNEAVYGTDWCETHQLP